MFLCDKCHFEIVGTRFKQTWHMNGSVGPCENCGKHAVCADCHCRTKTQPSDAEIERIVKQTMEAYEKGENKERAA